ncbi:glycosyltransferase family 2 protein [Rhodopila sp.]|uniref:glycosyltransferase family 2 protein n=1 Tax=Rhodopila sp. TaxID=2480087 RepID=UPI003D0AF49D
MSSTPLKPQHVSATNAQTAGCKGQVRQTLTCGKAETLTLSPVPPRSLDASVIICTRDRSAVLRQTLDAVAAMRVSEAVRYEVLVVDNASTDGTKAVVEAAMTRLPIRYLHESRLGLGRARNLGVSNALGRLIFITDDDCIVSPNWLETGLRLLANDPRQLIGGRVTLHDPRDLPLTIKTDAEPARLTSVSELFGFINGCNMIFGRCVFDDIGLFDPMLGAGTRCKGAEDTDLVYRAFRAGIPVRYCPELDVAHNHGRRSQAVGDHLVRGYAFSNGSMTFKHMLHPRLDLIRAIYWSLRSDARDGRPNRLPCYLHGAIAYLHSMLS